jgi:hypothetical protein
MPGVDFELSTLSATSSCSDEVAVSRFRVWSVDFGLAEPSSLVTLGKLDNAAGTCGDHCIGLTNYLTVRLDIFAPQTLDNCGLP